MTSGAVDLAHWLSLAHDVARQHRQGRILAIDPSLVLRGLPPRWAPALGPAGPADDVTALAGAALERLDDDDPARPLLLEAAAGCLGADLPGLLRQLAPLLADRGRSDDDPREVSSAEPGSAAPVVGVAPTARRRWRHREPVDPDHLGTCQDRLRSRSGRAPRHRPVAALAGLALTLAVGPAAPVPDRGVPAGATPLDQRPHRLADEPEATISWVPPHVVVEVAGIRYRYRFERPVDEVAVRATAGRPPTLVVSVEGRRWDVGVPVLDRLSGTAAPR